MRTDMKTSSPPPTALGDPVAERPKGKRPWNKPRITIIQVNFTASGFNADPDVDEGGMGPDGAVGGTGATYRTS